MIKLRHLLISAVLSMALNPAWASDDQIFNQVDLQTSASQQVDNDQLVAVLLVQETGNNPATLANKVNIKMAQIIDKANKYKAIEHQTINYNSRPIYKTAPSNHGKSAKISNYKAKTSSNWVNWSAK